MNQFCQDRDLLSIEPIVFIGGGMAAVHRAAGVDGQLAGTTFHSGASDFVAAGVQTGMVLCLWHASPSEGSAYEIVSVDSATDLTVSVLRAEPSMPPVAPPATTGAGFAIRSFGPRIVAVSSLLAEKLRTMSQAAGIDSADFADSASLRLTAAYGALADIFVARADNAAAGDANWIKAQHYRQLFAAAQTGLRLAVDVDGDGRAEQTRTLGNVTLRRA